MSVIAREQSAKLLRQKNTTKHIPVAHPTIRELCKLIRKEMGENDIRGIA